MAKTMVAGSSAKADGPFAEMQSRGQWQVKSSHACIDVKRGKTAREAFDVWLAHCGFSLAMAESLVVNGGVVLKDFDDGGKEYCGGKLARILGISDGSSQSPKNAAGPETVV